MAGEFVDVGVKKLGTERHRYFCCEDCGTFFPEIDGKISCNGQEIETCPWHGPDSRANALARGDHLVR